MKINTRILREPEILEIISLVLNIIEKYGIEDVVLQYGFDCKTDLIYQDIKVKVDGLLDIIKVDIANGIFGLGKDDIFIKSDIFNLHICNDSDLHFDITDKVLFDLVLKGLHTIDSKILD